MTASEAEIAAVRAEIVRKATRRVRARMALAWHVAAFVLINVTLIGINLRFTPNALWFVWPLMGWGLLLSFHIFATVQLSGIAEDMVDVEVQRELAKRGLT